MRHDFSYNINPDLKPLFAKVLDRFFLCEYKGITTFTDFYDPAKWTAFNDILSRQTQRQGLSIETFGGAENCERRMLGFFSVKEESVTFPIVRLRISHNAKFNKTPRHQDYLGSILGLGFDRGRIGDIFISEEKGYGEVFVCKDIADYICSQLEKIGRVPVKVKTISEKMEDIIRPQEVEGQLNVASLRLDVVVAALFKLSRGQASALIGAEKVFINWSPCTDGGKQIKAGDMITLRGQGRARVGEILGTTKKDRLRLAVFRAK